MKIDLGALDEHVAECERGGFGALLITLPQAKALLALARACVARAVAVHDEDCVVAFDAYIAAMDPFLPYAKEEA